MIGSFELKLLLIEGRGQGKYSGLKAVFIG
jgi:hypothetical protein